MAKINIIGELTMKQKFKKIAGITGIVVGVIGVGSFTFYKVLENSHEYEKKEAALAGGMPEHQYDKIKEDKEESEKQTAKVGGVASGTGLTNDSGEYEVISVMHKMTHQKVASDDKWGAVPMTSANIDKVINVVETNDFEYEDNILNILDKWKRGDFDAIVQDHNYFWGLQNGTIGKAYGIMSEKEEAKFIENNFK